VLEEASTLMFNSMPLFPVLAIILPLLGAGGAMGLSLLPRARPYARYVALTAVGLTTILIFASRWMGPVGMTTSLWRPSLLFGAALVLQSDVAMQPLALALALVTCSAVLVELSRTENPHPRLTATLLALLVAGFVALWSANVLTTIISWAVYDLLQAAGHVAAGSSARTVIRGLVLGSLATVLLWGGALLSEGGAGSDLWPLVTLDGAQLTLWVVAGLLRLEAYPFHLIARDDLGAVSLLLGPTVGWGLWLRLVLANGGSLPGGTGVLIAAAVTLGVGSFLAWSCEDPRHTLRWVGMGVTGAVLLAAGLAGESAAAVVVAGGLAWALGVAVLFLSDGLQREGEATGATWWSIPSLVGALALLGTPLTLGFVADATLLGGLTRGAGTGWGVAFFAGNLFLVPSLMRRLLLSSSSPLPNRRGLFVARGIGLGLLALPLIVAGLHPPLFIGSVLSPSLGALLALPGLAGWLLWAVSLAGGGVLAWQDEALRPKIELLLIGVHGVLCLEWFYDALVGALDRGLNVLRLADEVVEGAGTLLWSLLLFLLILLVRSRL
jgi:formate hydrogenlyase subunit 3/multisubunit Na+/H+ antiporter MnhD subunit